MPFIVISSGFLPVGAPRHIGRFQAMRVPEQVFVRPFQARVRSLGRHLSMQSPQAAFLPVGGSVGLALLQFLVFQSVLHHLLQQNFPQQADPATPQDIPNFNRPSNGAYRANTSHTPPRHTPNSEVQQAYGDLVDVLQKPALATGNTFKKPVYEKRKAEFHAAYAALLSAQRSGLNT